MLLIAAGVTALLASSPASTIARRVKPRKHTLTRYSLVHGCYSLRAPGTGAQIEPTAGPYRMQAAPSASTSCTGARGPT